MGRISATSTNLKRMVKLYSVLHVEDSNSWLRLIKSCIQEVDSKLPLTQTIDYYGAVKYLEEKKFALYILDGDFPGPGEKQGLELYNYIVKKYGPKEGEKCVFVSTDDELEQICRNLNVVFWHKSKFDMGKFVDFLRSMH